MIAPVYNLTFISKVIERVVSGRLNEHLIKNSMFDPLQSAYRDKHSTETALIKVQNDILSALDAGSSAILLMLDLSAAFDTIDHHILLCHHSYADDTQLNMAMDHSNNNWRDGLARIQLCVSEIREWMNQNMLKLNDDKTELIVFTLKYKQNLCNDLSITIGDTVVDCSSQVKDLGVIFDRVLSLRQHVTYTSKT